MLREFQKLNPQELSKFIELIRVFEDVFEMSNFQLPPEDYLQQLLSKQGFYVFVALFDKNVVGGLTAYTLDQYYSQKPLVYIYDLAVKREFQRQGIGKRLISELHAYCQEVGVEEVFVQAEEEDTHALDFYHSTGGTPEKVVHFTYPLTSDAQEI